MDKLSQETTNLTKLNIDRIAELFPSAITETKEADGNLKKAINFTTLKQLLSADVVDGDECYEFTWVGKKQSIIEGNKPIRKTLRPAKDESKNWDTTENLYIEGDNLEVLKLLQNSYLGGIKMMYFDPPYNTGNDFVYKDNFTISKEDYEDNLGMFDENENRMFKNNESNGRFHSDWCSMLYPRLQLARNLLSDDGAIFISIGVEELPNLKKIMDEVFGESNFIEIFSWVKTSTPPALSTKSRKTNEYILCYEKSRNSFKYNGELLDGGDQPLLNSGNSSRVLTFPCEKVLFSKSKFPDGIYLPMKPDRVELLDRIEIQNGFSKSNFRLKGEFKWTQAFLDEELRKGTTFIIKSDKLSIRFIRDEEGNKRPTNFIKEKYTNPLINKSLSGVGTNENASSELNNLMGLDVFSYPKPVSLISYLINFIVEDGDIVLDIFSGSGTTAESVLHWSSFNNKKLNYILIQLPEDLDENLKYADANTKKLLFNGINFLDSISKPHLITELAKERIYRAGRLIKTEQKTKSKNDELFEEELKSVDTGFRVLKLDSTNMKDVYYSAGDYSQQLLLGLESNIKDDRTDLDLLFGVLVDWGVPLSLPHISEIISGKQIHFVNDTDLVACFEENINETVVREIAKRKPLRVVFRDSSFTNSPDKINVSEIFKTLSPDTTIKVI